MIDFDSLHDIEYVRANIRTIYEQYKSLEQAVEMLKSHTKLSWTWFDQDGVSVSVSTSSKYVAKDINDVIKEYPIELFPEIYNISLSAKAKDVITETDLLVAQPSTKITFKINDN